MAEGEKTCKDCTYLAVCRNNNKGLKMADANTCMYYDEKEKTEVEKKKQIRKPSTCDNNCKDCEWRKQLHPYLFPERICGECTNLVHCSTPGFEGYWCSAYGVPEYRRNHPIKFCMDASKCISYHKAEGRAWKYRSALSKNKKYKQIFHTGLIDAEPPEAQVIENVAKQRDDRLKGCKTRFKTEIKRRSDNKCGDCVFLAERNEFGGNCNCDQSALRNTIRHNNQYGCNAFEKKHIDEFVYKESEDKITCEFCKFRQYFGGTNYCRNPKGKAPDEVGLNESCSAGEYCVSCKDCKYSTNEGIHVGVLCEFMQSDHYGHLLPTDYKGCRYGTTNKEEETVDEKKNKNKKNKVIKIKIDNYNDRTAVIQALATAGFWVSADREPDYASINHDYWVCFEADSKICKIEDKEES